MPIPESRTRSTTCPSSHVADRFNLSLRLRVLRRVAQQISHHLRQPHQISLQPHRLFRQRHRQLMSSRLRSAAVPSRPPAHDGRQLHPLPPQLHLAPHDPRHVQAGHPPAASCAGAAARPHCGPRLPSCASMPGNCRMSNALAIGASGLRSSWASTARNSSLRRSASRRCRSRCRRSVTSRKTQHHARHSPFRVAHRRGAIVDRPLRLALRNEQRVIRQANDRSFAEHAGSPDFPPARASLR